MTAYVSYFELGLVNGALQVRLGSGPANEIIERSQTDPCIRIYLPEPSSGSVRFRATCGVAELTSEGLIPILPDDPTQQRGAWLRLLPIATRACTALHHAYGNGRLDPAISIGLTTGWLKVDGSVVEAADSSTAHSALAGPTFARQETAVFVRLGGTPEQIALALTLLDAETT